MLISMAYAQEIADETTTVMVEQTGGGSLIGTNVGMMILLIVLFYFLLIRPQQKRFAEHKQMLDGLKNGDKIVTAGGLIGKIEKLTNDDEVVVDLGNGTKVTAVRATIQSKEEKEDINKKK